MQLNDWIDITSHPPCVITTIEPHTSPPHDGVIPCWPRYMQLSAPLHLAGNPPGGWKNRANLFFRAALSQKLERQWIGFVSLCRSSVALALHSGVDYGHYSRYIVTGGVGLLTYCAFMRAPISAPRKCSKARIQSELYWKGFCANCLTIAESF